MPLAFGEPQKKSAEPESQPSAQEKEPDPQRPREGARLPGQPGEPGARRAAGPEALRALNHAVGNRAVQRMLSVQRTAPADGGRIGGQDNELIVESPDFIQYTPGPESGFTGVYDPMSGRILIRPSGKTLMADGSVPPDLVPQLGGHAALNSQLKVTQKDKTLGFVLIYDQPRQAQIRWNSLGVNQANYGDKAVLPKYRQQIIQAVQDHTGLRISE